MGIILNQESLVSSSFMNMELKRKILLVSSNGNIGWEENYIKNSPWKVLYYDEKGQLRVKEYLKRERGGYIFDGKELRKVV